MDIDFAPMMPTMPSFMRCILTSYAWRTLRQSVQHVARHLPNAAKKLAAKDQRRRALDAEKDGYVASCGILQHPGVRRVEKGKCRWGSIRQMTS